MSPRRPRREERALPFPEAKTLLHLFETVEEYDPIVVGRGADPSPAPLRFRGREISRHMAGRLEAGDLRFWRVTPRAEVLHYVDRQFLKLDGDRPFWEVVVTDGPDPVARVFVKYSVILGSRELARLPVDEVTGRRADPTPAHPRVTGSIEGQLLTVISEHYDVVAPERFEVYRDAANPDRYAVLTVTPSKGAIYSLVTWDAPVRLWQVDDECDYATWPPRNDGRTRFIL